MLKVETRTRAVAKGVIRGGKGLNFSREQRLLYFMHYIVHVRPAARAKRVAAKLQTVS